VIEKSEPEEYNNRQEGKSLHPPLTRTHIVVPRTFLARVGMKKVSFTGCLRGGKWDTVLPNCNKTRAFDDKNDGKSLSGISRIAGMDL
jgi:hypothetical protein